MVRELEELNTYLQRDVEVDVPRVEEMDKQDMIMELNEDEKVIVDLYEQIGNGQKQNKAEGKNIRLRSR